MATVTKLGPADHGRPMEYDEYLTGDYEPGYKYELIDGRLYVSPLPNVPENLLEEWIGFRLRVYACEHPEVINYVSAKARVVVPGRRRMTTPEPDLAGYRDFPLDREPEEIRWEEVSPVLVVEVLVEGEPYKDLERNVELYLQVPSIQEYWVLNGREGVRQVSLIAHRRYRGRWVVRTYRPGRVFTSRLLPEFELEIDPRR
jgi:Uma2 family endonuclease